MTKELVESIVRVFLNWSEEEPTNIVDWTFNNNVLLVKIESDEDGMVEIFKLEAVWLGYAASSNNNNFEVVGIS